VTRRLKVTFKNARDPDLNHASPSYQQNAWDLNTSNCREPGGVHSGYDCSRLGAYGRLEVSFHYCTRLTPQRLFSLVSAGSLNLVLLRMYRVRRRASRMRLLGTPGGCGKARRIDKKAKSEFLLSTRDSDTEHASPW